MKKSKTASTRSKTKQYIQFDGLVYRGKGWSEASFNDFMDKVVEVAESFGKDVQLCGTYESLTAEKLNERQKRDDRIMKGFAKVAKKIEKGVKK